jgi:hypothetical protein
MTGQADAGHQPVHQEGRAHHVAARFQEEDEQEQDEDLRQEHDDRANPAQHAVDQQRAKPAFRHRARDGTLHRSTPVSSQPIGASDQANTA